MWVHVGSGITSRCITLAHAYYMVKYRKIGKKLTIIWPVSKECKIGYYDVFSDEQFKDIHCKVIEWRRGAIISEKEEQFISKGGAKYYLAEKNIWGAFLALYIEIKLVGSNLLYQTVTKWFKWRKAYYDYTPPKEIGWGGAAYSNYIEQVWQNIKKGIVCGKDMFVNAGSGIIRDETQAEIGLDCIKFRIEYWNKVRSVLKDNKNIVGVHIRRTDHNVAIAESKTEDFIRYMDNIVKEDGTVSFFLATDDKQEENRLKQIYGSKIITVDEKVWGRDSREGMKAGIVDVLCLSQCIYMLGSYTSVFSRFASEYGKCDLIVCTSNAGKEA
ncbi:MAG: hypothetical protein NC118_02850 [Eubacterium sp.]|nr:hypothetical protein [Eubacterium sp.]